MQGFHSLAALHHILKKMQNLEESMNDEISTQDKNLFVSFLSSMKKHEILLKYNLNLIDELHANENAHTRIFIKLLSFEKDCQKTFLHSFISQLNTENNLHSKIPENIDDFEIYGQHNYIDAYILSRKHKVAIIIENKINGAVDQEKQIERYIETAKGEGCNPKDIYCIYLTDDGSKSISDWSFTENAKLELEYGTKHSRFIELNYKSHILLFLKNLLKNLHNTNQYEPKIESALIQYIDYLEGRFLCREDEKEYFFMMTKQFNEIISNHNFEGKTEGEKLAIIKEYRKKMNKIFDSMEEDAFPIEERNENIRSKLYDEIDFPDSKKINSDKYKFFGVTLKNYKDVNGFFPDLGIGFTDDKELQLTFSLRAGTTNNDNLSETEDLVRYVDSNPSLKAELTTLNLIFDGNNYVSPLSQYSVYDDVKHQFIAFAKQLQKVLE